MTAIRYNIDEDNGPYELRVSTCDYYNYGLSAPISLARDRARNRKPYKDELTALYDSGNALRVINLYIKRQYGLLIKRKDINNFL